MGWGLEPANGRQGFRTAPKRVSVLSYSCKEVQRADASIAHSKAEERITAMHNDFEAVIGEMDCLRQVHLCLKNACKISIIPA